MKRALALLVLLIPSLALAGTKFVGGGLEIGPTAPVLLFTGGAQKVQVSQILYTQVELGFPANTHLIDVAWRKEGLGPVTGTGGCAVQVYFKNVTRQMGPFTEGSTQALSDALLNAQKVIDKPASSLPTTMGFVTLDQVENQFDFLYAGDGLEVTIITDCRAATSPIVDAPIRWRYDVVPERVRVASGDGSDGLTLSAEPLLSSFRPHTRFRTLVETPRVEIRVAGNVLPNGGNFGVAMNHFAAGQPAPFAFAVFNDSTTPQTVTSVTVTNEQNGIATNMFTGPQTVMPNQELATPIVFMPMTAGSLARLTLTWVTSAGTHTNSFQGTPTATPMIQTAGSLVKADGTLQTLTAPAPTVVQLGNVQPGQQLQVKLAAHQYGQGMAEALVDVVSGDATVAQGSTMLGTQQDATFTTTVRAPVMAGTFTTQLRLTVGSSVFTVNAQGTVVAAPDIAVFADSGELQNGAMDLAIRRDEEAIDREFRVTNVGASNLYVSQSQNTDAQGTRRPYGLPRVIAPRDTKRIVLRMPRYNAAVEPFESFILSDDPDETGFTWLTRSQFETGAPRLAMFAVGLGGKGPGGRDGIARGGSARSVGDRIALVMVNVGDRPLTISNIVEACPECAPLSFTGPLVLAPMEEHTIERPSKEKDREVQGEWTVESDDPEGPFSFKFSHRFQSCSAMPGPMLLVLAVLWLRRQRRE